MKSDANLISQNDEKTMTTTTITTGRREHEEESKHFHVELNAECHSMRRHSTLMMRKNSKSENGNLLKKKRVFNFCFLVGSFLCRFSDFPNIFTILIDEISSCHIHLRQILIREISSFSAMIFFLTQWIAPCDYFLRWSQKQNNENVQVGSLWHIQPSSCSLNCDGNIFYFQ